MGTETSESRNVPTEQHWDAMRPLIENLYLQQDRSLSEVLRTLDEHGFKASSSQLKRRLKSWGVSKNLSAHQMEEIAQSLLRTNEEALTKRSSDKEVAKVNGQSVSLSKVKRFQKRRQMPLIQRGPAPILPSVDTSSAPTTSFEKETYGLNYDWLEQDDELSIPIRPGLVFRNLFEDFTPLQFPDQPPSTSDALTLSQRSSRNTLNPSMDSDDLMDQSSKRKRSQSPNSSEQEGRVFACPFYKRDPARYSEKNTMETKYRSCAGAYLHDISRLKQHLYRVHRGPEHQCPRCHKVFASSNDLDQHITQQTPCPMLPRNPRIDSEADPSSHTISQDRLRLIKIRQRGKRQDEQWYQIFRILFPNEPLPASPYPGDGEIDEKNATDHFVKFFKVFSTAMPSESQKRYLLQLLPDSTRRVVESAIAQTLSSSENGETSLNVWLQPDPPPPSQVVVEPAWDAEHRHSLIAYPEAAIYKPTTLPHAYQSGQQVENRPVTRQNWDSSSMDWVPVWGAPQDNINTHSSFDPARNGFLGPGR